MSDCVTTKIAIGKGDCYASVFQASSHLHVNRSFGRVGHSPYQRPVSAFDRMVEELFCKICKGAFCFRNYEQTGGIFIDAVH